MNLWNDYKKIPLPKVLSFIVDNRGKTVPTAKDGNHKLIATNCIRNENLYPSYEKIRLLSEDTYQTWFRAHPIPGDIIFVCKGTPGRTCMVPDPIDFCIAQDMIAFRVDEKQIYNRYLLVVLRSREIQEQIANTSVGDVIPHFKKQFLDQLLIPLPPMEEQKRIVSKQKAEIQNINTELTLELNALKNDKAVIAAYARKMDYVTDDEKLVKITGLKPYQNALYDTGTVIRHTEPEYVSEKLCKLSGLVAALAVLLVMLISDIKKGEIVLSKNKRVPVTGIPVYNVPLN